MTTATQELPPGFTANVLPHVGREQISVLYHPSFSGWLEAQHMVETYESLDARYAVQGVSTAYIDVRSGNGDAVGVGCLHYDEEEGELSSLAVLPLYRSLGIGKWIIAERIRMARELDLKALFIGQLAMTNTLKYYYARTGFEQSNASKRGTILSLGEHEKNMPHLVYEL